MSYKDIAKIIFNGTVSKISVHNFIKNYDEKLSMDDYLCNHDGILLINCDVMWIKQNKTTIVIGIKNFVIFQKRN